MSPAKPAKDRLALKRGRPTAEDAARMERAILAIARQMFLTEGFDGAAMERVAAETGITRTTLYSKFATKSDLFRAVIEEAVAQRFDMSPLKQMEPVTDIRQVLYIRVAEIAAFLVDPQFKTLYSLIQSNRHRFPELGPVMHAMGYEDAVNLLVQDICAAAERDGMSVALPRAIAEHLIAAVYGWFLQYDSVQPVTIQDVEIHGRRVVDLLIAAREHW